MATKANENTSSIYALEQSIIVAKQNNMISKILLAMCAHIIQIKLKAAVVTVTSGKARENNFRLYYVAL